MPQWQSPLEEEFSGERMNGLMSGGGHLERGLTPDRIGAPAAGSLLFHGLLFGGLLFYGMLAGLFHHNLWGNPGDGGAIEVKLVSNAIPLPNDQPVNDNVLPTETPSKAPAPPAPKTEQKLEDTAIPISSKQAKPEKQTITKTQQHQPPPKPDNLAHFGEQSGSALPRATMSQNTASNGPVTISNGDFGSRFGWYVDIIKRKMSQNWNRYEVDPRTQKGTSAQVYFEVSSQGVPSRFKINTPSGSPTLDQSCLRAAQRIDTFGALPREANLSLLNVTYDCTY
jgi:protein TonB